MHSTNEYFKVPKDKGSQQPEITTWLFVQATTSNAYGTDWPSLHKLANYVSLKDHNKAVSSSFGF